MDANTRTAIIVAIFALAGVLITTIVSLSSQWLDRRKWHKAAELEERRFAHERAKWAREFANNVELELLKKRCEVYDEVLSPIAVLSSHNLQPLINTAPSQATLMELAEKLNACIYGKPALYMSTETRKALVKFRRAVIQCAEGTLSLSDLMKGERDTIIERLRIDLGHEPGHWRPEYGTKLEELQRKLSAVEDGYRA
ncbi:MAG: hypothetical protein M3437_15755 [Chloroflexota bacterium]|nr:hypothetical protein [Chloroflexota bacterium]MDQ5865060.1 hypothetical protein [Chloroflexota bacterium]